MPHLKNSEQVKKTILSSSVNYEQGYVEATHDSLPLSFEPTGANLIFGENARAILKNGSIIDIEAAKILEEMGIDVNLASAKPTDAYNYLVNGDIYEYFCDKDKKTSINGDLKEIKLKKDIELLS